MTGMALVVTHEASHTSAPRTALEVARSLREAGWTVSTVAKWPGPLLPDLADRSDLFLLEPGRRLRSLIGRVPRLTGTALSMERRVAGRIMRNVRPDLVWANTAFSASYVRPALDMGIPVVLHVHELEPWTSRLLDRHGVERRDSGLSLLAASPTAAEELSSRFGGSAVESLSPSIDDEATRRSVADVEARDRVVAVGAPTEPNGIDLWIRLAEEVTAARPGTELRWVGGPEDRAWRERAEAVSSEVSMRGPVDDPAKEIAAGTVFVVTTRTPGFRLVVLAAMALGRPIVAFDVPGVREQLADAGALVPPDDVAAMTAEVLALLDSAERRRRLGQAARERVAQRYSVDAFASRVAELAGRATDAR